jgi:four helix bundle protein
LASIWSRAEGVGDVLGKGRRDLGAMKNPDRLRVARDADELAMLVYDYTAAFPREERFGLAAHMRRTAISIGSSIFEGCGRTTEKGFAASLGVAHAEASELLFQIRIAVRRSFGDAKLGKSVNGANNALRRQLFNLIRRINPDA